MHETGEHGTADVVVVGKGMASVAIFSETVAHEVADRGVHIHVLYPAWVPTAMGMSGVDDGGSLPPKVVRRVFDEANASWAKEVLTLAPEDSADPP